MRPQGLAGFDIQRIYHLLVVVVLYQFYSLYQGGLAWLSTLCISGRTVHNA